MLGLLDDSRTLRFIVHLNLKLLQGYWSMALEVGDPCFKGQMSLLFFLKTGDAKLHIVFNV